MIRPNVNYEDSGIPIFVTEALLEFNQIHDASANAFNDAKIINRLVNLNNSEAKVIAGQMSIDLACREVIPNKVKNDWFKYGHFLLDQVGDLKTPEIIGSSKKIFSIINSTSIPFFRGIYLDNRISNHETIDKQIDEFIPSITNSIKLMGTMYSKNNLYKQEFLRFYGSIGELGALAILNRYFSRYLPDRSMVATPALISEDYTYRPCSNTSDSFDISIYNQMGGKLPEQVYKIQVKNTYDQNRIRLYSDDITVVNIPTLLLTTKEKRKSLNRVSITEILKELINERRGGFNTNEISKSLDERAEIILDELDN